MPLYKFADSAIEPLNLTAFAKEGLKERSDLQRALRDKIDVIAPGTMVLAEEFGQWEDSRRRIDLLLLDQSANLVVVELKRTADGGFMDLQAIRYAAMISNMTFDQAANAHSEYLQRRGFKQDARENILSFLDWSVPEEEDFAQDVRIVLASAEFSKELTTSVLWLIERDIDIRCVRLLPYKMGETILINAEQVIPLPEAEDYQIKVREKVRIERVQRNQTKDLTKYSVIINDETRGQLPKRWAIYTIVKALIDSGVEVAEITDLLSWRRSGLWRTVNGDVDSDEFELLAADAAKKGGLAFESRRWFYADDELIRQDGKTYALTKMWGERTVEAMESLVNAFPDKGVSFTKSTE